MLLTLSEKQWMRWILLSWWPLTPSHQRWTLLAAPSAFRNVNHARLFPRPCETKNKIPLPLTSRCSTQASASTCSVHACPTSRQMQKSSCLDGRLTLSLQSKDS
ncbi:hypothetical protein FPV67DRAFT_662145 [Lyophyllum atratum]|nr:hypothetical protein FPV67DRAFT_662145 [Lyophyllum atratum]